MGTLTSVWLMKRTERGSVQVTIARAWPSVAICAMLRARTAAVSSLSTSSRERSARAGRPASQDSDSCAIRRMAFTASTGYLPAAVSPLSITASAPAKMEPATSEASARVGSGASIMLWSICVATMQGIAARSQAAWMRRCSTGTRAKSSSMARSPRATIMASASAAMASRDCRATGRSILATMPGTRPRLALALFSRVRRRLRMSSACCTKDSATKSAPWRTVQSASTRSRAVGAVRLTAVSGRFTPLRLEMVPPTSQVHSTVPRRLERTRSCTAPSSMRTRSPGFTSLPNCG